MVATIATNPYATTVAAGSFQVDSVGYIQGTALDQPAIRNSLAGGVLSSAETISMWGGVGISEAVPGSAGTPAEPLGSTISRATTQTAGAAGQLTGFSVFDQNYAGVNTPQSPVPLIPSYGPVHFYRLGSGARIALKCDPGLVSLEGGVITQQVSWDYIAQELVPYVAAYPDNTLIVLSWASTNGGQATGSTTTSHGVGVGDVFTITGSVPTGYNGTFTAITGTTGNVLVWALATNPGAATTLGKLNAGGGALPVKVIDVQVGNSMTVSYDPVTGLATWNRSGACAVCLI